MRISDWSSDVCSSDLYRPIVPFEQTEIDIDATFLQQLHGFLKYRKGLETQKIQLYQSCPFNLFHGELSDRHIGAWVAIEWHQVRQWAADRKSTRLKSSHSCQSRNPTSP